MKLKDAYSLEETNLDSILKSRDITLPTKVRLVNAVVFPVIMYGCESWTIKKAEHWRIDAFELWCWRRLLRVPWTARRSNHPKGDQSWVFIGRTNAEAETPILWPPDAKNRLIWKDPDAGKDWRQEEKGTTEVGWHHWCDGLECGWTPGVGDGQGGLVCCSPWDHKESDMTEWLNWTELNQEIIKLFQLSVHLTPHTAPQINEQEERKQKKESEKRNLWNEKGKWDDGQTINKHPTQIMREIRETQNRNEKANVIIDAEEIWKDVRKYTVPKKWYVLIKQKFYKNW